MPLLDTATIREGSEQPIDLWFQLDTDRDGHAEDPLVFPNFQKLEVRLKREGETEIVWNNVDHPDKVLVLDELGTTKGPNGSLSSHAQITQSNDDFTLSELPYSLRVWITDGSGRRSPVPENYNAQLFVIAA